MEPAETRPKLYYS